MWPPSLRKDVKLLRSLNLTDRPVMVRVTTLRDKAADVRRNEDCFLIRLSRGALETYPMSYTRDSLIHEWAHCIVPWHDRPDHSARWGAAYARLWRALHPED